MENKNIIIKLEDLKNILKQFKNPNLIKHRVWYANGLFLEVIK